MLRVHGGEIVRLGFCCTVLGFAGAANADFVIVTNLVTDDQSANPAQITDPFLKNPWGVSRSTGSPFWVSDNATGVSTLYTVNPATNVTTKTTVGSDPSGGVVIPGAHTPTGQVFNSASGTGAFNSDNFLFVSEDGAISGWRGALGSTAELLQSPSASNVYKGATLNTTGGHSYLLSANFRNGTIDVLKGDAGAPTLTGNFTDPNTPAGYAPFNIQTIGSRIYVTYAQQDGAQFDDVPGAGHGFVTAFDLQGNLFGRIGSAGTLNSPWGLAIAPPSFTDFPGALLVANSGDGTISVFNADPNTPGFLGQLSAANGNPVTIDGLWSLTPGNDGNAGSSQNIYFTAGPNNETHGLFGVLQSVPEPTGIMLLGLLPLMCGRRRRRAKVLP